MCQVDMRRGRPGPGCAAAAGQLLLAGRRLSLSADSAEHIVECRDWISMVKDGIPDFRIRRNFDPQVTVVTPSGPSRPAPGCPPVPGVGD